MTSRWPCICSITGVAVVAASAFGGQDGFRISFAADDARLAEALSRIAKALQ